MSEIHFCSECQNPDCPAKMPDPNAAACGKFVGVTQELTVFEAITASYETLAENLVYRYDGNGTWRSFLLYGYEFLTQKDAIAATVAKLKEVEK